MQNEHAYATTVEPAARWQGHFDERGGVGCMAPRWRRAVRAGARTVARHRRLREEDALGLRPKDDFQLLAVKALGSQLGEGAELLFAHVYNEHVHRVLAEEGPWEVRL